MAYIYRYQLKDEVLRDEIILTEYSEKIQSVIGNLFHDNLKDCFVEKKYFEFKLYKTVSKKSLLDMGRKLKVQLSINTDNYGFVRMEQTLYALVSSYDNLEDNENIIHIEFIDSILIDKNDQFVQRANNFYNKSIMESASHKIYDDSGNIQGIIKNYYIDILEAYFDKDSIPELLISKNEEKKEKSCFLIKGYHRHRFLNEKVPIDEHVDRDMLLLEKCIDVGYVEKRETINGAEISGTFDLDYIKILSSDEQPEIIEKIENELKLVLQTKQEIDILNQIGIDKKCDISKKCVFKVHNVGQALITSLSYENDVPFLYFDYGMPYGKNSNKKLTSVNIPTNPGTTIIISHTDKDHWFRIAYDFNAYQCYWYIPNQQRSKMLNHILAEIIVCGGSVNIINNDIVFQGGRITYSGVSKINSSRVASRVHETGLTMRIEAYDDEGADLNILISGDQQYDYVDQTQLNDIDILVASHHGGSYCWSTRGRVPSAKNNMTSIIIYSYGKDNTYNHPSKVNDYISANWKNAHHTCFNGEFAITLDY